MSFGRGFGLSYNKNRAIEAEEERLQEEKAWEERRLNAVGLSMLPRPDRVTMLDMAYLSGKIYEDPKSDAAYSCDLPDGKSLFNNCSLMLKSWSPEFKIYHNGTIEITPKQKQIVVETEQKKYQKFLMNFATPTAGPDSRGMPSEFKKTLEEDVKNERNILKNEIDKNSEVLDEIEINTAHTNFKAAIYVNRLHHCSVLVLRGTVTSERRTLIADVAYTINMNLIILNMYKQAVKFYKRISMSNNFIIRDNPIVACTGHSLGGIIAKMIAPVTGLSTYTFNSPGVKQYLAEKKLRMEISSNQEIITFYAKGDWIGNFRKDNDFGRHIPFSLLGVDNEIPFVDLKKDLSFDGILYIAYNFMTYHGMVDIFRHLNETNDGRKHVTKSVKYDNKN